MEIFLLVAKTHLAPNWQRNLEDTHFLKRLTEDGAFSFQKRSGTMDSFHTATLSFYSPSNFHVTGFKVLFTYFSFPPLERPCVCMVYHRDVPAATAEPSTCALWCSA